MMNLADYALNNRALVKFFIAVLVIGGIFAFNSMSKLEDPEIKVKQAMVVTVYPGASAYQVELEVTDVLEKSIRSMGAISSIESKSMADMSLITVELESTVSPDELEQKWDILRRKVTNAQAQMPDGARPSVVMDDFGDVYGMFYAITTDGVGDEQLLDYAQLVKRELQDIEGVRRVEIYGNRTPCINIEMMQDKMANLGVHPMEVLSTLNSQNKTVYPGYFNSGDQRLRVAINDSYKSIEDIKNLIIQGHEDDQLRLRDIASITEGYEDPARNGMKYDGKQAFGLAISMEKGGNIITLGEKVDRELLQLKESRIPVGVDFQKVFFQPDRVRDAINVFMVNLVESVVIVILVLMLTMGFRSGVIIGTGLVIIVLGSFVVLYLFDGTLQRVSLGSLIVAMGMLVDNAIVVTDNAQIAIARGVDRRKALIDGATSPQWGLLGATFIAICSFLPLYLAPSAVAEIVKPLFVVLAISLGLSWVLALTQTTVFGNFILKAKAKDGTKDPYDKPFYHKFASILRTLIRRKTLTLGSMVVLFVASLVIMGMMPQNFFPSLDKPYFRADVFYPDGYSINDVVKEMKSVEEHLAKQPEVKKVSITFGSTPLRYYLASTSVGPKPNFANVLVELTDSKYTKEYEEDFDAYMKANYPNAITRTSLFKLSPAVDAAIEIGFIGPNVDTLVALTNQALEIMHRNPDLINVRNSWGNKVPVWKPVYSPERAQPLGVSRQGMAQSIQIGTTGMTLGEYRQGDQVLPILLKDNTVDSFRINDLRTLPVFGTGNETTSLEQVVSEFDFQYRFSNVKDYNRQMVMMAQCDPRRGVNAIAAFNEVWPLVQKEIKVPEGYTMKYFGEQESQVESNEALAKNLPLTFFLMFVTLLFLFRTYRKPTVILLMLPLIFIGIVLGLVLLGKSFDFFSILGLLGLIGMNIKNAIVLVEQIDLEAKTGKKPLDAVVSATTSRIVPVAMASGTTILGMLPLLFDAMFGGMAATIMGGLLVASALTLFVLPVAYCAIQRIKG